MLLLYALPVVKSKYRCKYSNTNQFKVHKIFHTVANCCLMRYRGSVAKTLNFGTKGVMAETLKRVFIGVAVLILHYFVIVDKADLQL